MMEFRMKNGNHWARLLAYVTGLINQELLLQNEYLAGVVSRNPRNFRHPNSSPATSASKSMGFPSLWKV